MLSISYRKSVCLIAYIMIFLKIQMSNYNLIKESFSNLARYKRLIREAELFDHDVIRYFRKQLTLVVNS